MAFASGYRTAKIYISLKHGETITKELHTQFKEGRNCDLEIRLNQKRLYVHKCLIDIFFIKAGAELEDDRFFLDLTRYSQHVVEALIGLVYTGNLRCSLDQVENVYKAAAELGCVEAQTGCQTYLRDNGVPVVIAPVNSRDSSSSPGILPNPFPAPPAAPIQPESESDPLIVVKTEPVDDFDGSQDTSSVEPAKQVDSGTGRYNYRSTFLVPVSSSNVRSTEAAYQYTMDSHAADDNLQQNTRFNVSNAKLHPALPAPKSYKTSSKKKQFAPVDGKFYAVSQQLVCLQNQTKTSPGKKRGKQPKVAVLRKDIVNKIRNFQGLKGKQENASYSKPESTFKQIEPEKHNFSATADEDTVDDVINRSGKKANMIEYRTKSGTVYYKHADSNSLSQDEFSVDTDDGGNGSCGSTSDTLASNDASNNKESPESEEQTVLEKWLTNASTVVKTEIEDASADSGSVEDIEAQKNEQMFSLGLTKKTDKKVNEEEGSANNSGRRRLRTRKKVDYSSINIERGDFDDSSDYDPQEDTLPKKRYKSHSTTKGRNLKIDSANLVTIVSPRQTNFGTVRPKINKYDIEERPHSSTIAVRQDITSVECDDDSGVAERVYFPPAGSVPDGVNSQYAQGTFLKVKYVTETLTDADGNVTVLSKRVPVRPRQFGLDERLKSRPAVYVCHPTAPVVKPVIRKNRP